MVTPYPGERREDYYNLPTPGDFVRLKGLVSTTYLRRGETMVVRWTDFWTDFVVRNYVGIVSMLEEPAASEFFPTMAEVWSLIERGAQTLPGERILGFRATGAEIFVRVGTSENFSREYAVSWPELESIVNETASLRDKTRLLSENAQGALSAGVADLKTILVDYNGIAVAAAKVSLDAAEEAREAAGESGRSAYEIALLHGFEGAEEDWLTSLQGSPGQDGEPGPPGKTGPPGEDGKSVNITGAVADADGLPTGLDQANAGQGWVTQSDGHLHVWSGESWTDVGAVRGPRGTPGQDGEDGRDGTDGSDGEDGLSAYELALQEGFTGTREQWLASLVGEKGDPGDPGQDGRDGEDGAPGKPGPPGTTSWDGLDDKPSAFPPTEHQHPVRQITGLSGQLNTLSTALNGRKLAVVSSMPSSPDANTIYFVTGA